MKRTATAPAGRQRQRDDQAGRGPGCGASCSAQALDAAARPDGELAVGRRWPMRRSCSTSSSTRCCSSGGAPSNIVIGGAAGCFPVLVGWAAVTGTVSSLPAVVLFAVDLPVDPAALLGAGHEVPRGLRAGQRADAAGGGVAADQVTRKILVYSYAMVAATLALAPYAGWIYGVAAAALGGWFLVEAHRLHARVSAAQAIAAVATRRRPGRGTGPRSRCGCSTCRSRT